MSIGRYLTVYRVRRDHSDEVGFFVVDVPEVSQRGLGFQLRFRGVVYGVSLHTRARARSMS